MIRRGLSVVGFAALAVLPLSAGAQTASAAATSGPTFTPYGFVLLNAFFNTRPFNGNDYPDYAVPRSNAADSSFLMEARAARLGVRVGLGQALGAQVGAVIEGDFLAAFSTPTAAGGSTKIDFYRPVARMRLAYGTATWSFEGGKLTILAGQDFGLATPLFATSIAWITTPLFQNAGNLYIRAPQLQVKADFGKDSGFTVAAAALDPQEQNPAGSLAAQESALLGPGNRSRMPQLDARVAGRYKAGDFAGEVGVSGSYHKERFILGAAPGTNKDLDATLGGVDWLLRFPYVELRGEAFLATNQDTYFAHLGQGGTNVTSGPTVGGVASTFITAISSRRSKGFWAQAILSPIPVVQLALGYGVEVPFVEDLHGAAVGNRVRNSIASAELIFLASKSWKAGVGAADTYTTTTRTISGTGATARQTGVLERDGVQWVLSTQYTF